jgi:hypothetical protein
MALEDDDHPHSSSIYDNTHNDNTGTINDSEDSTTTTTTPPVVSTVSAFSSVGLLKLLENEGCHPDHMIPNWYYYFLTQLQPLLASPTVSVRLSLLPHQQYAIVWMYHMEHLPNFGINSLFWEEREFMDAYHDSDIHNSGGDAQARDKSSTTMINVISNKYYVNTALGQIRLEPPETMKGGLLCDEMGLGKQMPSFVILFLLYTSITLSALLNELPFICSL